MSGWRDLVQQYRKTLKPRELEELPDLLLCRPPAFLLAKLLARTPVTPDAVSIFAMFWSAFVAYGFAQGEYRWGLVAGAAYYLWNVLDCVDGQLARMKKQYSPIGYILDQVVDQVSTVTFFVGMAIGLNRAHPGESWLLITAGIGLLMGMECGVLEAKRFEWMARVYGSRKSMAEDLQLAVARAEQWRREGGHLFGRFVVRFYQVQRWLQMLYTSRDDRELPVFTQAENDRWARHHRKVLRMAVWLGPTTQMFVTLVCTAIGRIDYYLWAVLVVGLPWAVLVRLTTLFARWQERRDAPPVES